MTHTQAEWMWMYLCEMHADWDSHMLRKVQTRTGPGRVLKHHARRAGWYASRPDGPLNAVPRIKRLDTNNVSWLDLAAEPSYIEARSQTALDQHSLDVVKHNLRRAQGRPSEEYDLAMAAASKARHCAEKPPATTELRCTVARRLVNQSTAPPADNGQTATQTGDRHERDTGGNTANKAQATASVGQPPMVPACDGSPDMKEEGLTPSLPCGQAQGPLDSSPDLDIHTGQNTQYPPSDCGNSAPIQTAIKAEPSPDTPLPPPHTRRVIGTGTAVCLEQVHHASQCDNAVCPVHVSSMPLSSSLTETGQQQGAGCTAAQNTEVAHDITDTPLPPSQTCADTPNSMPDIKAAKTRKWPRRRCRDSPTLAHIGRQLQRNKRQLSPDGAQQPNDCDDNEANKRRRDGDTDSCTNSSDDSFRDLDSPETGRVTVSPRLLCSKEVKEHSQATGSPALTSVNELIKKQIWHLTSDKTEKPTTALQTINSGSGSKRKVKDTINLAPNPVKGSWSWTSPPQGTPMEPSPRTPTSGIAVTRQRSCKPGRWKPKSKLAPKLSRRPHISPPRPDWMPQAAVIPAGKGTLLSLSLTNRYPPVAACGLGAWPKCLRRNRYSTPRNFPWLTYPHAPHQTAAAYLPGYAGHWPHSHEQVKK